MQSKLPKPDTQATYSIKGFSGLPDLTVTYKGEVRGSDIKWNNSLGILTISDPKRLNLASCHIGQFTGNCGAKYIAHLRIVAPTVEAKKALMSLIESFAYHVTNCGFIVGSDTSSPYEGETLVNIRAIGGYEILPEVKNPNWNHKTRLFWRDITGTAHTNYWDAGKVEKLAA